ncbi:metallophosphoesterase [Methanobacterium movens]
MELSGKGHVLIITDIHGNWSDFNKFINIWDDFKGNNNHLVITGDFIHSMGLVEDKSIEVLEQIQYQFESDQNFHVLLGNHEWSLISSVVLFKNRENLSFKFENLLKKRFPGSWKEKLEIYIKFFKKLPVAVKTNNKVFISHSGPSKNIKSIEDIINISDSGYVENKILEEFLWNRYGDYNLTDIDNFLKKVDCRAMVVGHTPVDGAKLVGKKQLIISSSYTGGSKAYLILDLEKKINDATDLMKMVKFLD